MEVLEAILDPLDRRCLEDLLPASVERVDLVHECLDPSLRLHEGLGERLASAPLADEVDEVGQPALLGGQLGLLQLQRVRQIGAELGDLLLDATKDVRDVFRISQLVLDGTEDYPLGQCPADERLVVAGTLGGGEAPVVTASYR